MFQGSAGLPAARALISMHEVLVKCRELRLLLLALLKGVNQRAPQLFPSPGSRAERARRALGRCAGSWPSCDRGEVFNATRRCGVYRRWITLQSLLKPAFQSFYRGRACSGIARGKKVHRSWEILVFFPLLQQQVGQRIPQSLVERGSSALAAGLQQLLPTLIPVPRHLGEDPALGAGSAGPPPACRHPHGGAAHGKPNTQSWPSPATASRQSLAGGQAGWGQPAGSSGGTGNSGTQTGSPALPRLAATAPQHWRARGRAAAPGRWGILFWLHAGAGREIQRKILK